MTGDGYAQRFTAHGPDGVAVAAGVALPGRHNVANALLAHRRAGRGRRRPGDRGRRRSPPAPACPAGWSWSTAPGPVLGVVDYAHKPDAIVAALAALRELAAARAAG